MQDFGGSTENVVDRIYNDDVTGCLWQEQIIITQPARALALGLMKKYGAHQGSCHALCCSSLKLPTLDKYETRLNYFLPKCWTFLLGWHRKIDVSRAEAPHTFLHYYLLWAISFVCPVSSNQCFCPIVSFAQVNSTISLSHKLTSMTFSKNIQWRKIMTTGNFQGRDRVEEMRLRLLLQSV